MGFSDKKYVGLFHGSEMSAGCYSRNLILGILCGGKATLTEYLEPNC